MIFILLKNTKNINKQFYIKNNKYIIKIFWELGIKKM